jgi:hypothetical protein
MLAFLDDKVPLGTKIDRSVGASNESFDEITRLEVLGALRLDLQE